MGEIVLRNYQQDGVDRLRASYGAGNRAPLLVLPTGGGKTVTFAYIAQNAAARGKRALILVHRQELLRQSSATLSGLGVGHGLIAAGGPMSLGQLVQVASVQTLTRRLALLDKAGWRPDLIVVDEAHHATAGSWRTILDHWPTARVLGVTATPCRQDGNGLGVEAGGVFDDMVEGPQIADLIARGYLAPPEVYAPPVVADLTGLRSRMGDFAQGEAADRMDRPTVTGDAVAHYARLCPGVPAIVFCVSVAHAEHVAEQFRASGWAAASLDGSMPDPDRRARIDDLAAGRLQVLTSCDIISEGTDIPVVGAAILLRPTQSLGLYLQQVGRALRLYPGKRAAIILDHVGNVARHGLPDDPREWSLEGVERRGRGKGDADGPPPPVTCEGCFRQIVRPLPPCCPSCGKALIAKGREAGLQHVEGDLIRITAADRQAQEAQRRRDLALASAQRKEAKGAMDRMTMAELVMLAKEKGYPNPSGWAWRTFSKRKARASTAAE